MVYFVNSVHIPLINHCCLNLHVFTGYFCYPHHTFGTLVVWLMFMYVYVDIALWLFNVEGTGEAPCLIGNLSNIIYFYGPFSIC